MYAGHTREDGSIQPLIEHLNNVAQLAGGFASAFQAEAWAVQMGLSHDIGKYSKEAQKRLLENGTKVDHSTAGGQEICKLLGQVPAYGVFGHHGGLPNGGSDFDLPGEPTFCGKMKRTAPTHIPDYTVYRHEVSLAKAEPPGIRPLRSNGFTVSFLTRMLFSCLVDADFLDTEAFIQPQKALVRSGYESIDVLLEKLTQHTHQFSNPSSDLNKRRSEILESCFSSAKQKQGLYSLTVPTGGGKTIASLAYALTHAKTHGLRRIIYIIPYTSILEQTAAIFSEILGAENVLEHHSLVEFENDSDEDFSKKQLSTENWDAPVIVTTNVQFFESLFASRTSTCRKIHHIAQSVLIFDEAQMIPLPYLRPCVEAISELVQNYSCTALLCTATQPALDDFFPKEQKPVEICNNPAQLHHLFKRTTIRKIGELSDEALASRLLQCNQALCIVNTRKQAQALFALVQEDGSFHLSTAMYPAHRRRVLNEIRERLKNNLSCRVLSTSLVEAGVDLDFPEVFRAKNGLDSVVQAAGRCNREGKRNACESFVNVFTLDSKYNPPPSQRQHIAAFDMIERENAEDLAHPHAIKSYFKLLYTLKDEELDKKQILPRLEKGYHGALFPFKDIAEDFCLIENDATAIFIPLEEEAKKMTGEIEQGHWSRKLLQKIGLYSVNVYRTHLQDLYAMGMIEQCEGNLYILRDLNAYSAQTGLQLSAQAGNAIFT